MMTLCFVFPSLPPLFQRGVVGDNSNKNKQLKKKGSGKKKKTKRRQGYSNEQAWQLFPSRKKWRHLACRSKSRSNLSWWVSQCLTFFRNFPCLRWKQNFFFYRSFCIRLISPLDFMILIWTCTETQFIRTQLALGGTSLLVSGNVSNQDKVKYSKFPWYNSQSTVCLFFNLI